MSKSSTEMMVMYTGAKFGAIAGFIATWSISTAIAASELELGQQIGFNNAVNSAYPGFWPSHNHWEHCRSHTWSRRNKMEKN